MSGAGKSTLVRCINLLERPSLGNVILDGKDLTTLRSKELLLIRRQIGMIFQSFNLFEQRNILQNVCYPLRIAGVSKKEAVKKAHDLLEMWVSETVRKHILPCFPAVRNSVLQLARALATDPKYLLCDEATSALDPNTTQQILDLLKRINNELGVTIIVITHEMRVIDSICDRVAVIDKSHIAEEGPVAEVFLNPQSEIARELILPQSPLARKSIGTRRIRIIFDGESSDKPVISDMILECQAGVNIVFADTKDIDGKAYGQIIIQLPEDKVAADKITTWLDNNNMKYSKEDDE